MSPPHPCCGESLQRGTRIVAIADIVLNVIYMIGILLTGIFFSKHYSGFVISLETGLLFLVIIGLVMSIFLLKGANERNVYKCKAWMIYSGLFWILSAVSVFLGNFLVILDLLAKAYFMWVTYAFIKELQMEKEAGHGGNGVVSSAYQHRV